MAAQSAFEVTTSDTVDLPGVTTGGIYIGGTGTLQVTTKSGKIVKFAGNIPVGTVVPIQATRVWATGTSATLIVGLIT